jgi:hypothetical protein
MALTARAADYAVKELKKEISSNKGDEKIKMGMIGGGKMLLLVLFIACNMDGLNSIVVLLVLICKHL